MNAQPKPPSEIFLGVGNAMGLQFSEDAWSQGMDIAPLSVSWHAFPLTASVHNTDIAFDELLVVVLLQACLGGSATMFRVQKLTSYCFRFFAQSTDAMHTILHQDSIRARRFTLVFDHIHLAPKQILPQIPVTTIHPTVSTASPTTNVAEQLQPGCSTTAVLEADDTQLERVSKWTSEDGPKFSSFQLGAIFCSLILQKYHSGVVLPLFNHRTPHNYFTMKDFWISFISATIKPSAFLVKNLLDHLFIGYDAFSAIHEQRTIFKSFALSKNVIGELILRSLITLPGVKFYLSPCLAGTKRIEKNIQNHLA
jgi:hypothetical protein